MSSESPSFLNTHTDYFLLWIVVISGVAIGNLVSNFITASYLEAKAEQTAAQIKSEVHQQATQTQRESLAQQARDASALEVQQAQQLEQLRAERRQDSHGQQLSRACAEWTRANASMNSYTTQSEMNKHCGRLNRYLDSGMVEMP